MGDKRKGLKTLAFIIWYISMIVGYIYRILDIRVPIWHVWIIGISFLLFCVLKVIEILKIRHSRSSKT